MTINLWGVPNELRKLQSPYAITNRESIIKFCNQINVLADSRPHVIAIQELWDNDLFELLLEYCPYHYYAYSDDKNKIFYNESNYKIYDSKSNLLSLDFFYKIKNDINKYLKYLLNIIDTKLFLNIYTFFNEKDYPSDELISYGREWIKTSYYKAGLIILSDCEIIDSSRMVFSDRGNLYTMIKDWERSVTKGALSAKINCSNIGFKNKDLIVSTTHLIANHEPEKDINDMYKNDRYEYTRLKQFKEFINWSNNLEDQNLNNNNKKIIALGDLNSDCKYPIFEKFIQVLKNFNFDTIDNENLSTYSCKNPLTGGKEEGQLDHILSKNLTLINKNINFIHDVVSDHYALNYEFNY